MNLKRQRSLNIVLAMLSIVASLVIAEVLIGLVLPQKTLYPRYQDSREYRLMLPANATLVHSQGNLWTFTYTTNGLGHRGALPSVTSTARTRNIVALGDSFTFGMGINDGLAYTNTLRDKLGDNFSVINAGLPGWGLDSEIKRFYEHFADYEPEYVILQFTQNDPEGSATGVTAVVDGQLSFYDYQSRKPAWQKMVSESEFLQNSQLYAAIRNSVETLRDALNKDHSSAESYVIEQKQYIELLKTFAAQLRDENINLLFLSVTHRHPDLYHYDLDHFPLIKDAIKAMVQAGLIIFIELPIDELKANIGSPEGHQWNTEHHQIVGETIARAILDLDRSE